MNSIDDEIDKLIKSKPKTQDEPEKIVETPTGGIFWNPITIAGFVVIIILLALLYFFKIRKKKPYSYSY